MAETVVQGVEGVLGAVGQHLGYSELACEITQERVNLFADATGDHQWIHVDPERATARPLRRADRARLPHAVAAADLRAAGRSTCRASRWASTTAPKKVRFPSRCRWAAGCGRRRRSREATPFEGGVQMNLGITMEIEGQAKPAMVASILFRRYV